MSDDVLVRRAVPGDADALAELNRFGAQLRVVAEDAERDGTDRLLLSSWSFNACAREAWRHLGFEPQSTSFSVDPRRLEE